ncbi:MAG: cold-shock protein [Gammaproteobacteria bacterium]|nr:MAG: cold-shock protein [Gammaproteobacteria bacterium]
MSSPDFKTVWIAAAVALPVPLLAGAGVALLVSPPEFAGSEGWSKVWGEGRMVALYGITWLAAFVATLLSGWLGGGDSAQRPAARVVEQEDANDDREEGTVKWFNANKGFGFITRSTGEDIFVHFRAIRGRGHRVLKQGQVVRFQITHSEKGLQADDVSVVRQA